MIILTDDNSVYSRNIFNILDIVEVMKKFDTNVLNKVIEKHNNKDIFDTMIYISEDANLFARMAGFTSEKNNLRTLFDELTDFQQSNLSDKISNHLKNIKEDEESRKLYFEMKEQEEEEDKGERVFLSCGLQGDYATKYKDGSYRVGGTYYRSYGVWQEAQHNVWI